MTGRTARLGIALMAVLVGCAQPTSVPAKRATAAPAVPIAPPPATAAATPRAGDGDPQSVERRAAAQAKAIEEILAAQNARPGTEAVPPDDSAMSPPPPLPVERPHPAASTLSSPTIAVPPPAAPQVAPLPAAPSPVAPQAAVEESTKPSGANSPMSVAAPDGAPSRAAPSPPGRRSEGGIEQQIADRATQNPRDVAAQLDQQLLLMAQGQPVPTPQALAGLPPDDREMLSTLVDGLSNFRAAVAADSNMLMTQKIKPLGDMVDRLRSESDLTLPAAAVCSEVKGFGNYTAFSPAKFDAMTETQMIVYCEVANFVSRLDDKNMYTTNLHQDLVLYSESGLPVWSDKVINQGKNVTDVCRNRRHDFFLITKIKLPPKLSTGRHVLKVTVIDLNANHYAETNIPIAIVAR